MDQERIELEMHKLEEKIGYQFQDIQWLARAMNSTKIDIGGGKNHKEYMNEGLALIGDTLLKFVITEYLHRTFSPFKGEITIKKASLESNQTMHSLMIEEGWDQYAYNEYFFVKDNPPQHLKVTTKGHDPYIEAIVGAIFYDSGIEATQKWIVEKLFPLLEKYKEIT